MTALTKTRNKKIVTQSNELTEAAYHLGLQAKRIIWLCLGQIKKDELHQGVFTLLVADYQNIFEVDVSTASRDVKKGLDELCGSIVAFYPKNSEYDEIKRPWLAEAAFKSSRGEYSVEFNHKLLPYIVGLSKQFTTFNLHECGRLNSVRSIRLYESLCQYRSSGVWAVNIDWLGERYQLPKSQRENFAEFKRSFLEPAIKRINKETPLLVSYSENMQHNKVSSIVFSIIDSKQ